MDRLTQDTLRRIIENFVTNEGTDYGHSNYTLEAKVEQVIGHLKSGRAKIIYDATSDGVNIVATKI